MIINLFPPSIPMDVERWLTRMSLSAGKLAPVLAMGAFTSTVLGVYDYTGGRMGGWDETDEEAFERKMRIRTTRRRPIEETIAEIGEGRGAFIHLFQYTPNFARHSKTDNRLGIQPPGYEERRRQRLKEKYGYDVNPVKATVDGSM